MLLCLPEHDGVQTARRRVGVFIDQPKRAVDFVEHIHLQPLRVVTAHHHHTTASHQVSDWFPPTPHHTTPHHTTVQPRPTDRPTDLCSRVG